MYKKIIKIIKNPHKIILILIILPAIIIIRFIRPWLLVRWGVLPTARIGHFAANTELYLCERKAGINMPNRKHVDIWFIESQISNQQLLKMWKRVLNIYTISWIVPSIQRANRLIPYGANHEINENSQSDRDIHNLFERYPQNLYFTSEEEAIGQAALEKMGIPLGASFVCLIVRDSAYLDDYQKKDWTYHNYRDSNIDNYVLAAETLAERGYFVIRMGAKVKYPLKIKGKNILDYAYNGMRNDFMDIYLGAKCNFCISTATGFDAVPQIFRRPIVYVNTVPVGYLPTFRTQTIGIFKHHFSIKLGRNLSLKEIFATQIAFAMQTDEYQKSQIQLIENSDEEIRDILIEMDDRLNNKWKQELDDQNLQETFKSIYEFNVREIINLNILHGNINIKYGANMLRKNREFLK